MDKEDVIYVDKDQIEVLEDLEEYRAEGGNISQLITALTKNPGLLKNQFSLDDKQATNVKAIITGVGTGAAMKYFSPHIGDELAAVSGALLSAFLAKKFFGR